jgi:F-type H+-transporting ATPase subunit b
MLGLLATVDPVTLGEGSNQIMVLANQFGIKPHLLLAQIVNFCLVAWIFYALVLRPIRNSLDKRAMTIDEGLRRAEDAKQTLTKAHKDAEELVNAAQRQASDIVEASRKAAADYEAREHAAVTAERGELLEKARADAQTEYRDSLRQNRDALANMVVQLSEKALGEELTPEQRTRFAERAAEKL